MSLRSFLERPDVRERFKREFPREPIQRNYHPIAPPLTEHYSLVGIAFDYLLRFYIMHINTMKKTWRPDIKHSADGWRFTEIEGILAKILTHFPIAAVGASFLLSKDAKKRADRLLLDAEKYYHNYLDSGKFNREMLKCFLGIAGLETAGRVGLNIPEDDPNKYDHFVKKFDERDINDLDNLLSLVQPKMFLAKKVIVLNPLFGSASSLVGGADADIILDDMILEIKTTKELRVTRKMYNQLIGYYVLSRIGEIKGLNKNHQINRLGIYFSRFGEIVSINIDEIIDSKSFPRFVKWFINRAKKR